jgi:hypothetical protein
MKKLYSLIIFSALLFAGEKSFAQALTVVMHDTTHVFIASSDIQETVGDTLYNNTPNSLQVKVLRWQNAIPSDWTTDYCLAVCYLPTTDSVIVTLAANKHQNFDLHFNTGTTLSSGTVLMEFRNVSTPSNKFYQHFYVTNPNAVNELNAQDVNVKISPNPIITGSSFSINISEKQNYTRSFSLTVYDIIGNAVANFSGLSAGSNSIALNAQQGIYFYKLVSENQQLSAGKLIVTQ